MAWLKGLLGLFNLVGFFTRYFERRERDRLLLDAESKKRAEQALAKNKKDAADAAKTEADVRRMPDADLDAGLRRFSRKPKS